MRALEDPLRAFSKKVTGMWNKPYCDRVYELKILSIELRAERYMTLYVWKSVNGFVLSLGLSWRSKTTGRSGPTLIVEPIKGKIQSVKTLKSNTLKQHGTSMFNMLPGDLKTFS